MFSSSNLCLQTVPRNEKSVCYNTLLEIIPLWCYKGHIYLTDGSPRFVRNCRFISSQPVWPPQRPLLVAFHFYHNYTSLVTNTSFMSKDADRCSRIREEVFKMDLWDFTLEIPARWSQTLLVIHLKQNFVPTQSVITASILLIQFKNVHAYLLPCQTWYMLDQNLFGSQFVLFNC